MGWIRSRKTTTLLIVGLIVASCGGDGSSTSPTEALEQPSSDATPNVAADESTEQPSDEPTSAEKGEDPGERSAVITIDGESTSFALADVTFSPVEGVDDLTFETCDPDFFGSGRFYAIGYAVDADGELILGDDDQPGTFTMDLPPDDWEATQRDAPGFDITLGDLDIAIATPEEAAGGTMAWTIEDTRASGTAVFVDFESSYMVDFEVVCEDSPTVAVDDLPSDDAADRGDGGGLPAAGGVGSFTVDGESFENVEIYSCEPFSFGSDPDPRDLSLLALLGGSNGLQVELSHRQGVDMSDGTQFDHVDLSVFHSRQGESGVEQFEGSAASAADGTWFTVDPETFEQVPFDENPVVIDGDRITGSLAGLDQTWPDEGAATVDVTWEFEIPSEVVEGC